MATRSVRRLGLLAACCAVTGVSSAEDAADGGAALAGQAADSWVVNLDVQWVSRGDSVRSGAHLCVACLTHAAALTAPFAAAVHAASVAQTASPLPSPAPAARLGRTPCSGLSPPSAS